MPFSHSRRRLAALVALLAVACGAGAQSARPSLREAAEAAWQLSPQARALDSRQAELDARGRAVDSFLAGAPSLSIAHKAGRGAARGEQETEAEVSAPLRPHRLRTAMAAQLDADRASLAAQIGAAKLKLSAEARELAAAIATAEIEQELAARKVAQTQALLADVERRVKAGESARIDLLRAQAALREAQASQVGAGGALARAQAAWRALTGLPVAANLDEVATTQMTHPVVAAAQAQAWSARARLDVVQADRRDPVEVGIGLVRERPGSGLPTQSALRLSLRLPLGGDIRNGASIAGARAQLDEAEAELDAARRHAASEREGAQAEYAAAHRAAQLAQEREQFVREVQELIAKSHRLGESDLSTRLRADAERFDAELARTRALVEMRRALSKLNQANGSLP